MGGDCRSNMYEYYALFHYSSTRVESLASLPGERGVQRHIQPNLTNTNSRVEMGGAVT